MSGRFGDEVAPLQADGRLEEGTMFGFRFVYSGKAFVAMPGHESDGMWSSSRAKRVIEILESGRGRPVGPAGKVFKEGVEIAAAEEWGLYLEEALDFAGARAGANPDPARVWRSGTILLADDRYRGIARSFASESGSSRLEGVLRQLSAGGGDFDTAE